jgi:serine/threonine-protein kinase
LILQSHVAVKLIEPEIAGHPEAVARFEREARAAAQLRSRHVVQVFDVGAEYGVAFIVMELLEGESLGARLLRRGKLTPAETAILLSQVAHALTRAHQAHIVHRDLKPDNIFVARDQDEEVVKVLDFGIVKATDLSSGAPSTQQGMLLGTPQYMSPEQVSGAKDLDYRADLWAFGVIAYECLTGERPFERSSPEGLFFAISGAPMPIPSTLHPVPAGFDAWFARACARDRWQRFGSAREAASELARVCQVTMGPGGDGSVPPGFAPRVHDPSARTVSQGIAQGPAVSKPKPKPKYKSAAGRRGVWRGLGLAALGGLALLALYWSFGPASLPGDADAPSADKGTRVPTPASPSASMGSGWPGAAPTLGSIQPGADSTGADSTGADSTGADSTGADSTGADSTGAVAPSGPESTGGQGSPADSAVEVSPTAPVPSADLALDPSACFRACDKPARACEQRCKGGACDIVAECYQQEAQCDLQCYETLIDSFEAKPPRNCRAECASLDRRCRVHTCGRGARCARERCEPLIERCTKSCG